MEKRRSLLDTNVGQKFSLRHPTIIDTQPKSNHIVRNAGKSMPKIKLTSNDKSSDFRSISSPRLKSFPAEEMRRLYKSPRPNVFPFPAAFSVSQSQSPTSGNNKNSGQGDSTISQPTLPPIISHNHNQTLSQPYLTHPTSNQARHSEIYINTNSHQRSPDRQVHRPFVPNTPRYFNQKEPQTTLNRQTFASVNADNYNEDEKPPHESHIQSNTEFNNVNNTSNTAEYEKQPVGGRNAAIHRQVHLSKEKHPTTVNDPMPEAQISNQSHQNPKFHHQFQQQIQPPEFYYDSHHVQQPNVGWTPTVGMMSPQNLNINQGRSDKNNSNQFSHQQMIPQTMTRPSGAAWTQSMIPRNPELYNSCQYTKQNLGNNRRLINPSFVQQHQQEYPPRRSKNTQKNVNKNLAFTPAMIHDQELLVTTMRQQGISEEIMKRQFNALLTEQRRHLMYEEQFEKTEEKKDEFNEVEIQSRRKISKFDGNEKPEWMVHITPPRIPYALVEKMKNESSKERKKSVRIDENINQTHQQQPEFTYMTNNENDRMPFYNVYQQQPGLIHNNGHYYENLYCQTNCNNPASHATQQIDTNSHSPSILKTQNNTSAMTRHKYQVNNGLQDLEVVKKTMEKLKNAQNHKGFEYLINLNKKEQRVQLNGVQDPDDPLMHNLPYRPMSGDTKQEMKKGVAANGLENKRNLNNPSPSPMRYLKNYDQSNFEYPRRKVDNNFNNYYIIPAEKENGTIANSMINGHQQDLSAYHNSTVIGNARYENFNQAHDCCQVEGKITDPYNYRIPNNLVRSNSLPPNMYSERQHVHFSDYPEIQNNIDNDQFVTTEPKNFGQQFVISPNTHAYENTYMPEQFFEARIIGGVKYIARKTGYIPQSGVPEVSTGSKFSIQPVAFY